jgi:uncharacterized damage-inducible protein DinB
MTGLSAIRLMYRLAHKSIASLIDDLTDEEWVWQPSERTNSIAWIACHIVLWQDKIVHWLSQGAWATTDRFLPFETGGNPSKIANWPSRFETRVHLENVQAALLSILERAEESFLERDLPPAGVARKAGPPKVILPYLIEHQIEHIGQISLLRKMMGKEKPVLQDGDDG